MGLALAATAPICRVMDIQDTTQARVMRTVRGMPASDGAGVKLTRVIGQPQLEMLDPFLMLDEFGTDKPEDLSLIHI